jgi:acetyltransferase-like isoleucine patch superfamily enzyme
VLIGPNVQIYAATHPLDGAVRQGTRGPELGRPVTIGSDAFIGGACVILPGVSIGEHAVVGAGSVVTRDVPPYAVVAGNPARVVRRLEGSERGEAGQQQQQQQAGQPPPQAQPAAQA